MIRRSFADDVLAASPIDGGLKTVIPLVLLFKMELGDSVAVENK